MKYVLCLIYSMWLCYEICILNIKYFDKWRSRRPICYEYHQILSHSNWQSIFNHTCRCKIDYFLCIHMVILFVLFAKKRYTSKVNNDLGIVCAVKHFITFFKVTFRHQKLYYLKIGIILCSKMSRLLGKGFRAVI